MAILAGDHSQRIVCVRCRQKVHVRYLISWWASYYHATLLLCFISDVKPTTDFSQPKRIPAWNQSVYFQKLMSSTHNSGRLLRGLYIYCMSPGAQILRAGARTP